MGVDFGARRPVAVLGATGAVGQRLVALLDAHPWFELVQVAASGRSAGRSYGEAVRWHLPGAVPAAAAALEVLPPDPGVVECDLVFSALDASVAGRVESAFAAAGRLVVTNARNHRMDPDVPLVIPEVNPESVDDVRAGGAIVANPNCSTIGLALALKPLLDRFGVQSARVVSMQALSGAGVPGVASLDAFDNVLPWIEGEEEKLETETSKILGPLTVSAQCNRVPVLDGHLLSVSVELAREAAPEELVDAWTSFRGAPQELALPSAPERPVWFVEGAGPQPRLHRELEGGMAISVGRLKRDVVGGWRFVTLSHNTVRGAAGGALLVGELLVARGRGRG